MTSIYDRNNSRWKDVRDEVVKDRMFYTLDEVRQVDFSKLVFEIYRPANKMRRREIWFTMESEKHIHDDLELHLCAAGFIREKWKEKPAHTAYNLRYYVNEAGTVAELVLWNDGKYQKAIDAYLMDSLPF